jgi:hypothetical protein
MYRKEPLERVAKRMRSYRRRKLNRERKQSETSFRERLQEFYKARRNSAATWVLVSDFLSSTEWSSLKIYFDAAGITPVLKSDSIETARLQVGDGMLEICRPKFFIEVEQ